MTKNKNSNNKGWTPKLSVMITKKQYFALDRLIPWGWKSHIFQRIIDDLVEVLDSPLREKFLQAMLAGKIKLEHFSKELGDIKDNKNATKSDKTKPYRIK